jgi:amino acid transporter
VGDDLTGSTNTTRDERLLHSFGYSQQLKRTLKPLAVLGISFSFMSITTSVYVNFGFGLGKFGTASIWLWPAVLLGQLFVAFVIAELGSRIPLAGYSYQWGTRLINTGYGWMIAILVFAYLLTCVATISYVLVAPFLGDIFGWTLSSGELLLIAIATVIVLTLLNIFGVALFARVNNVAVFCEIVSTLVIGVIVAIAALAKPAAHHVSLFNTGGVHGSAVWGGVVGAMVMGFFALTGFEAAADMSEESVGASRAIPRAVIWSLVGTGLFGMIALICFASAVPDIAKIAGSYTPVFDVIAYWLGTGAARVLLVFPLVAVLGTCLAVIAVEGRLIFALARDNIAPFSRQLRSVNGRSKVPTTAIVTGSVLAIAMLVYAYYQGNTFLILVGATSILPFVYYLLIIVSYAVRRTSLQSLHVSGMFTLGKWSTAVFAIALAWLVAALLMLTLQPMFHQADIAVLGTLGVGVVWYVAVLHWRVKAGTAGAARIGTVADSREGVSLVVGGLGAEAPAED